MPKTPRLTSANSGTPVLKLNTFLPYRLNNLAEAVSRSFSRIYADEFGIGIPEWRVVATLGEHAAMTARDIGLATSMHKTKVSRAVAALETKGHLSRGANPDDQREQLLRLTPDGRAMYEALIPKALAYSKNLETALTDAQRTTLDEIFKRLHAAVED